MKFSINNIRDIKNLIRELTVGLVKLSFTDNFESFEWIGTISASSVKAIRNELQVIPTKRIIVRQDINADLSDSSTDWDNNYVYLENHTASDVTLTVIFIK